MRAAKSEPTVPLNIALHRVMASVGDDLQLAEHRLNRDLRSGRLEAEVVQSSPDKETRTLLKQSNWRQWTVRLRHDYTPSGFGTIVARVFDKDNKPVSGVFFVRRADLDRHYPAAMPTTDDKRPPQRRRGPVLKYNWLSICGEIARRCIDPKTGRVAVPNKGSSLVEDMRDWCEAQGWAKPARSEMAEAVRRVSESLRTVQK
jgi:hypothetical protein